MVFLWVCACVLRVVYQQNELNSHLKQVDRESHIASHTQLLYQLKSDSCEQSHNSLDSAVEAATVRAKLLALAGVVDLNAQAHVHVNE